MGIIADGLALVTGFGSIKVVHEGVTTRGILDDAESPVDMGDGTTVLVRSRVLRVATASLPTLGAEDTIQLGGVEDDATLTSYRVTQVAKEADGVITQVQVITA